MDSEAEYMANHDKIMKLWHSMRIIGIDPADTPSPTIIDEDEGEVDEET